VAVKVKMPQWSAAVWLVNTAEVFRKDVLALTVMDGTTFLSIEGRIVFPMEILKWVRDISINRKGRKSLCKLC